MISDQQLLEFNKRGLFPGPNEDEPSFLARIAHLQSHTAVPLLLFDIAPDWIPITYSNKNLPFFQGGATWIENQTPRIQLRTSTHYLGLYHRDEILLHEVAHACRAAFEEPRFEEVFAYATSQNRFRKYFGPLFRTANESYIFLIVTLLSQIAALFYLVAYTIPFLFLLAATLRLAHTHKTLSLCLKNIRPLLNNPSQSYAVAYRMTDNEIALFANSSQAHIDSSTLRWRLLKLAYFRNTI